MTDVQVGGPLGPRHLQGAAFPPSDIDTLLPSQLAANHSQDEVSSQSSTISRHSQPSALHHSTSDVSGFVDSVAPVHDLTPPSSNASPAPESGQNSSIVVSKNVPLLPESVPGPDVGALRKSSHSPDSASSHEGIAGSKRTASGEFKVAKAIEHAPPAIEGKSELGHVRSSSTVSSTSSTVAEISSQLRTKLKYAMLKVQNGWQARSIDELESIASASPRSAISGFQPRHDRAPLFSSQPNLKPALQRAWSDSSSSDDSRTQSQMPEQQSQSSVALELSRQTHNLRALAPPADIKSGSRRRPTPNQAAAPLGMSMSTLFSSRSQAMRPATSHRTPSQHAAMEADAVETLLFMASPNNSGYHPPSQTSENPLLRSTLAVQTSPLRAQFSQTSVASPKKVAFSDTALPDPIWSRRAEIDHMLDAVPDDSEDENDSIPPRITTAPSVRTT